ncbi:alkaline phosphatase [uncultured Corynebacterium sp.]|uniref:alkaline phosphatase D family protein n=1 Tax=uncultured Corynebacterium sp. TaxID=159447 RepID=UPI0025CF702D|nr:alkaline phosphatase D family protein [uncultured Corynebacterium sp.]
MRISRRQAIKATGLSTAALLVPVAAGAAKSTASPGSSSWSPGLITDRPTLTHGVAAGDVRADGGLIWARSDRPAHMIVETAATPDFANAREFRATTALAPESDGTGRVRLVGLESGQDIHYRVRLEDVDTAAASEPITGVFRTAPTQPENIRLHWSGDVAGQGWGINPDIGGMTGFTAMAERDPHLFIHSGDTCYADGPIEETVTLDDGRTWRNVASDAKAKVAETLDEYRGQYAYNLTDDNYRRFNASVAQVVQWDDHETTNNWYAGEILDDDRYAEKNVDVLAERAYRAFHEWQPLDEKMAVDGRVYRKIAYGPLLDVFVLDMRTYKDDNRRAGAGAGEDGTILGAEQVKWLVDGVASSRATWKIIAADLPIGIVVPDGDDGDQEGVSDGGPGAPRGREAEIAGVLSAIKDVANVVWLTADVHYTAAHHYSPERASFQDFSPFWEFVSGPLNAGAFGPNDMDPTFGPEVVYVHAPGDDNQDASPLDDFQHFGEVDIDGQSREMTVRLLTTRGTVLWEKSLAAK